MILYFLYYVWIVPINASLSIGYYFQFWIGYRGCTIGTQRSVCSSLEAATRIAESVCGFWKTSDKKRFDDCVAGNAIVDEAQKAACQEALTQICNKDSCPQNFFDPLCKLSNV